MSSRFAKLEPLISVVICTRNRADLLPRALTSMVEQAFPHADYEVLVVDNGSTDRTCEVINDFQNRGIMLRYLREERIGVSMARNTGWRSAAGRYVAYFDDDAIASPSWLAAIYQSFADAPANVGAIGGPVKPIWEKPRPAWLEDEIACSLTIVDWGSADKLINDPAREWLVSVNMAIPKKLLAEVGGFDPRLGRVGDSLLSNEDTFLQKELIRRGYSCLYRPAMVIGHLVPASRLSQDWFLRRYYWQGISDAMVHVIESEPSVAQRIQLALTRVRHLLRQSGIRPLLFRADQPQAFTKKCLARIDLGYAMGILGAIRR